MMCAMRTLGVLLAALLLAGCGGGSDEPAPDAEELAAQFDCEGDADEAEGKVSCETEDAYYGITVYDDNDARDADVEAATSMGVAVLVGDRFIIDSSFDGALDAAREKVGGEIEGG
jgi:hypothetical protein